MSNNTYNGWTNWETWLFKLWLDNDEYTYSLIQRVAKQSKTAHDLSDNLRNIAEKMMEETGLESGFYADICNNAIKMVDFLEIATTLRLDIEDEGGAK